MAPVIAIACQKGGIGSSSVSEKLACGLSWEGQAVDLIQVTMGGMLPSFSEAANLPFGYVPLTLDDPDSRGVVEAAIDRARAEGRGAVVDLPPVRPWDRLLERTDLLLVPLRPSFEEVYAACATSGGAMETILASDPPLRVRPWLLPVGWTSAARAAWVMEGMRNTLAARSGRDDLLPNTVPWNVPRLLPRTLDALSDPEVMEHTAPLRAVVAALTKAAKRLATDPAVTPEAAKALLADLQGGVPDSSGDHRDLPQKLADLAEDKRDIMAGQGPLVAELEAAPTLEDWREVVEFHASLEGRVRDHPELGTSASARPRSTTSMRSAATRARSAATTVSAAASASACNEVPLMLRIWVELVPGGIERLGRQIACATIGNIGGDPLHADYGYRLSADASAFAPAVSHEGIVSGHSRRQTVWALVWTALDDWWATEGCKQATPREPGRPWVRALLEADGRVLQFSHGPWRVVRVGDADWLLLHGAEARARWSDLDADAARERLLGELEAGG